MTQSTNGVDMLLVCSSCSPTPLVLFINKEEDLILIADCRFRIILLLRVTVHSNTHVVHGHVAFQLESIILDHSLILVLGVESA